MSFKASKTCTSALGTALLLVTSNHATAHTIVGNRVFPATLTIDDPGVNDELALPSFAYMAAANSDGTLGPLSYSFGWDYAKTITANLGISVGSNGFTLQRNPYATGWANIETQLKYVFYQNAEHEFIIAGATSLEIGRTGSPQNSSLPPDPFSTLTPKIYIGKGFGDAEADWARPFAITGEIDYSFPTHPVSPSVSPDPVTGLNVLSLNQSPTVLTYGATIQYSLLYMNSYVQQLPEFSRRLIPTVEAIFNTPVSNIGVGVPGVPSHTTTGTVGPALYYIGNYFEIGIEAAFPINQASGKHVGAFAVLDFFLDDIFPNSIGKPLFGPSQAELNQRY